MIALTECPELMTVDEAAVFLRTTPVQIRHMVARGQLEGAVVRLGRRVLFRVEGLRKIVGLGEKI